MITEIFLSVDDAKATAETHGILTAGAIGIKVHVDFKGERWSEVAPSLIFVCLNTARRSIIVDGESTVPPECLIEGERLYVGIDGVNDPLTIRIPTTLAYCGQVYPSVNGISPENVNEPSSDFVDQILYLADLSYKNSAEVLRMATSGELDGKTYELKHSDIEDIAEVVLPEVKEHADAVLNEKVDSPAVAEVGQILVVKSVDGNGKPISWECVDISAVTGDTWRTVAEIVVDTPTQMYWLPNIDIGNCNELIISYSTVSTSIASLVLCNVDKEEIMSFINATDNGIRYGKIELKNIDGDLYISSYISGSNSNNMNPGQTGRNNYAKIIYGSSSFGKLNIKFNSSTTVLLPGTRFVFYGR